MNNNRHIPSKTIMMKTSYYSGETLVTFGYYENGEIAIQLFDGYTGEPLCTPTVNLDDYCIRTKSDQEIIMKTTTSNDKAVLKALRDSRVVGDTVDTVLYGINDQCSAEIVEFRH